MSEPRAMRVLLVTKGLDIGGIERIVVDMANGLALQGVEPHVAVVNDRRDALAAELALPGPQVHRLGGSDRIGWRAALALARLVRDHRYDVVHVHGPLPAIVARLTPGRRHIITTSHTPLAALRLPTRLAWRWTVRRDATVIAVSASVAAGMPKRVSGRVHVIPHGLDMDAIERARAGATAANGSALRLVTVASHRDAKNYPNLLHAVRVAVDRGADVSLVAVGDGPDLERHRVLTAELGIADRVAFRAAHPAVLEVIAAADVLVVASDYEGQPLVVMEALALGVPVVATAVGRVPELVTPAVGRIVPPGDPQALGEAIASLATDPAERARLAENTTQRVGSWTLHDVVQAHVRVYEQVTRGNHWH